MKKNITTLLCGTALVLACASSAFATGAIRYSLDGGAWVTVNDGDAFNPVTGGGDSSLAANSIGVNIIGGGFDLSVSSKGFKTGSLASPIMDLSVDGSTTGSGTLVVEYSDTGFTPVSTGSYQTSFKVNNLGTSASERTILGANTLFAGGDLPLSGGIGPIGPFVDGTGSSSAGAPAGLTAPYSITLVQVLTSTGSGQLISTDAHVTVPDGGNTLVLLGSALSVLGLGAFRRKNAVVNA